MANILVPVYFSTRLGVSSAAPKGVSKRMVFKMASLSFFCQIDILAPVCFGASKISSVVAAEDPCKDDVSCRVCFVLCEILDPQLMKNQNAVVSFWVCGSCRVKSRSCSVLHVVSCRVYVCDAWDIEVHGLESNRAPSFAAFAAMAWTEQIRCFMSGWGFVSGLRVLSSLGVKIHPQTYTPTRKYYIHNSLFSELNSDRLHVSYISIVFLGFISRKLPYKYLFAIQRIIWKNSLGIVSWIMINPISVT